jgi:hypothetical protein
MLAIAAREADIIDIQTATLGTGRQVPDPNGAPGRNHRGED